MQKNKCIILTASSYERLTQKINNIIGPLDIVSVSLSSCKLSTTVEYSACIVWKEELR